jgi:hypothetical protein
MYLSASMAPEKADRSNQILTARLLWLIFGQTSPTQGMRSGERMLWMPPSQRELAGHRQSPQARLERYRLQRSRERWTELRRRFCRAAAPATNADNKGPSNRVRRSPTSVAVIVPDTATPRAKKTRSSTRQGLVLPRELPSARHGMIATSAATIELLICNEDLVDALGLEPRTR